MVSWITLPDGPSLGFPVESSISAFKRVIGTTSGFSTGPTRARFYREAAILASPGSVNLNAVTRFQYYRASDPFYYEGSADLYPYTSLPAVAILNFAAGDFSGTNPNLTATMFLAPASAFAGTPTPSQIIASSTEVHRAYQGASVSGGGAPIANYRTTAGSHILYFKSYNREWNPNEKWWVCIVPTHVANMDSAASIANDPPIGDPNANGRALSFWTNRTPLAPVVTSPGAKTTVLAGAEVDFIFASKDPDRISTFPGDNAPTDFNDVAGVQVQYAPAPTTANPDPVWADLPVARTNVSGTDPGWFIDGSLGSGGLHNGVRAFWQNSKMKIRCGDLPLVANAGVLPSGDWQIRVRTFDYGHSVPDGNRIENYDVIPWVPPLADRTRSYTASNYPAVNTSPWSTPTLLSISTQVPPPVPIAPKDERAIVAVGPDGSVLIDDCNTTAGWTAQEDGVEVGATTFWEAGSVSYLTFTNPDMDADSFVLQRDGEVDFTSARYLTVEALMASMDNNLVARADGVPLDLVSKDGNFFIFRTLGGVVNNLAFEHIRPGAEPGGMLKIRQLTKSAGAPVTLSWLYRNTYITPLTQANRTVQIRKVGDLDWTTLVDDQASASASYTINGFDLVSGNRYEWRVKVRDTSGVASEYSEVARFWYVPAPATGDVLPDPGDLIDGATLGCGTHRIEIYRRGGRVRVGEITNVSRLKWGRVRDDISTTKIEVRGWGVDCGNLLARLQSWAYEVVIFRDNGYTVDRVWEGPITLLTYESDVVTIHAKDVMAYAYRRIVRQSMSDSGKSPTAGATVTNRAERVLQNALAPDDPNMLAHLRVLGQPDDAKQYRSMPPYSRTAFEEVDDMAANAGLDYTTVGRSIILWGTKHRIGTLPEFRDKDLGASPIVSEYGMSMSNVYAISDGNGVYGEATRLNEDEKDPTYGRVEMLSSTWASEADSETGTYTEAGIETIKASFAASAERSISDRYPPPVIVRVPDNTRLNPDVVLSIQHLVPGVVIPLRSTSTLREVAATQKLDSVFVTEENGEESITVTMSPFSRDDIAAEGSGEGA